MSPVVRARPALLLIGPTGSGKTPLGDEIGRRGLGGRRCVHFDFGANLRSVAAGGGADLGLTDREVAAVRASLASGALFEDRDLAMIVKIVEGFAADRALGAGDLLVLNGLPRHVRQAEGLAGLFAVELVVELEADAAVVRGRMRLDPDGDRSGRPDGSPDSVGRRLADYLERTRPLLAHYRERGARIVTVPVSEGTRAGEMYETVATAVGPLTLLRGEGSSAPPGDRPTGPPGRPGGSRGRR